MILLNLPKLLDFFSIFKKKRKLTLWLDEGIKSREFQKNVAYCCPTEVLKPEVNAGLSNFCLQEYKENY